MFALAGNSKKQYGGEDLWKLSKTDIKKDFHNIKDGELGGCPTSLQNTYLCKAGTKQFGQYSGPSGWGTPNGIGGL
jgi:hypothetical protein